MDTETGTNRSFEYFSTEYARDVEHPCSAWSTKTTAETIGKYLENTASERPKENTVCVGTVGVHDQRLLLHEAVSTEKYVSNVKDFLNILSPYCGHIIWVSMTAVGDPKDYDKRRRPQRNETALEWNAAVYQLLLNDFPSGYFLDVFGKSGVLKHHDYMHMDRDYYNKMASFLFQNVTGLFLDAFGTNNKHDSDSNDSIGDSLLTSIS